MTAPRARSTDPAPPIARSGPLVALVLGHLVIAAVAVVVVVSLLGYVGALADPLPFGLTPADYAGSIFGTLLGAGVLALLAAQVLAIGLLFRLRRTLRAGRLDDLAVAVELRDLGWPLGLAQAPLLLGVSAFTFVPLRPLLLGLLTAALTASLLLGYAHVAWVHRHSPHRPTRPVPLRAGGHGLFYSTCSNHHLQFFLV